MSELYISNVGVRNYEYITSSSHGKQNKGTIMQIKGMYNPSSINSENLDEIYIRDTLNNINFFKDMSVKKINIG
jgi:hypothetical protein